MLAAPSAGVVVTAAELSSSTEAVAIPRLDLDQLRKSGRRAFAREVGADARAVALERWPQHADALAKVAHFYETNVRDENGFLAYDNFTQITHKIFGYVEIGKKASALVQAGKATAAASAPIVIGNGNPIKKKKKCLV